MEEKTKSRTSISYLEAFVVVVLIVAKKGTVALPN